MTRTGPRLPACVPPVAILVFTLTFSLVFSYKMTSTDPAAAFYSLPSRFWQARSHPDRALIAPGHKIDTCLIPCWQLMSGVLLFELEGYAAPDGDLLPACRSATSRGGERAVPLLSLAGLATAELLVVALGAVALTLTPGSHDFPLPWSLPAVTAALGTIALGSVPRTRYATCVPAPLVIAARFESPAFRLPAWGARRRLNLCHKAKPNPPGGS